MSRAPKEFPATSKIHAVRTRLGANQHAFRRSGRQMECAEASAEEAESDERGGESGRGAPESFLGTGLLAECRAADRSLVSAMPAHRHMLAVAYAGPPLAEHRRALCARRQLTSRSATTAS